MKHAERSSPASPVEVTLIEAALARRSVRAHNLAAED
jgi:hypothetical protein